MATSRHRAPHIPCVLQHRVGGRVGRVVRRWTSWPLGNGALHSAATLRRPTARRPPSITMDDIGDTPSPWPAWSVTHQAPGLGHLVTHSIMGHAHASTKYGNGDVTSVGDVLCEVLSTSPPVGMCCWLVPRWSPHLPPSLGSICSPCVPSRASSSVRSSPETSAPPSSPRGLWTFKRRRDRGTSTGPLCAAALALPRVAIR